MRIVVNGESAEVAHDATIAMLVSAYARGNTGVAVACNNDVVPRSAWAGRMLAEGDEVEILTAVQGG